MNRPEGALLKDVHGVKGLSLHGHRLHLLQKAGVINASGGASTRAHRDSRVIGTIWEPYRSPMAGVSGCLNLSQPASLPCEAAKMCRQLTQLACFWRIGASGWMRTVISRAILPMVLTRSSPRRASNSALKAASLTSWRTRALADIGRVVGKCSGLYTD